ncbi:hypothetical protein EDD22DRAFT_950644 [Suillus occidentalis]|nr:hypothetical protein EDD22DRAFT_950644 [Suillus occidentalis]
MHAPSPLPNTPLQSIPQSSTHMHPFTLLLFTLHNQRLAPFTYHTWQAADPRRGELFTDDVHTNTNTPRITWKSTLFSEWTEYGGDYEGVTLVAPGSSVEADFDNDQNTEAFHQIVYNTARDELAEISK